MALVLLIGWPLVEIYLAIRVAEAIGVLWTLLLLIAGWPIGTWAIRSKGRAAWERLGRTLAAGGPPGREVLDGALVLAGGMLMMVPGFITDLVGLGLLLSPTRALMRRLLARNLQSRLVRRATRGTRTQASYDVESTASDLRPPRLHP